MKGQTITKCVAAPVVAAVAIAVAGSNATPVPGAATSVLMTAGHWVAQGAVWGFGLSAGSALWRKAANAMSHKDKMTAFQTALAANLCDPAPSGVFCGYDPSSDVLGIQIVSQVTADNATDPTMLTDAQEQLILNGCELDGVYCGVSSDNSTILVMATDQATM